MERGRSERVLLIDNYDSFTFNLYQLVATVAGPTATVKVIRNDAWSLAAVLDWRPSHVLLSPGPGHPAHSGLSLAIAAADIRIPTLGVCLGHQAIALAHGAAVVRCERATHGRALAMHHDGSSALLANLPQPFVAGLYHSLAVDPQGLSPDVVVTARTEAGDIMALEHTGRPLFGVQFHPESFLTEGGALLMQSFLEL